MKTADFERDFELLVAAAITGERCPQSHPHGEIRTGAITALVAAGKIRTEVYRHNYRVVTILVGKHKGKTTAAAAAGLKPYRVNGLYVGRFTGRYGNFAATR